MLKFEHLQLSMSCLKKYQGRDCLQLIIHKYLYNSVEAVIDNNKPHKAKGINLTLHQKNQQEYIQNQCSENKNNTNNVALPNQTTQQNRKDVLHLHPNINHRSIKQYKQIKHQKNPTNRQNISENQECKINNNQIVNIQISDFNQLIKQQFHQIDQPRRNNPTNYSQHYFYPFKQINGTNKGSYPEAQENVEKFVCLQEFCLKDNNGIQCAKINQIKEEKFSNNLNFKSTMESISDHTSFNSNLYNEKMWLSRQNVYKSVTNPRITKTKFENQSKKNQNLRLHQYGRTICSGGSSIKSIQNSNVIWKANFHNKQPMLTPFQLTSCSNNQALQQKSYISQKQAHLNPINRKISENQTISMAEPSHICRNSMNKLQLNSNYRASHTYTNKYTNLFANEQKQIFAINNIQKDKEQQQHELFSYALIQRRSIQKIQRADKTV